jgi:BolA family transcriptional regulator, general stress-responsive regulator
MTATDKIAEILREALAANEVSVEDEGAQHVGHPGAASGGGHYHVRVVSPRFEGKSMLERHRMVYQALADEMQRSIHALALTTLAPSEQP